MFELFIICYNLHQLCWFPHKQIANDLESCKLDYQIYMATVRVYNLNVIERVNWTGKVKTVIRSLFVTDQTSQSFEQINQNCKKKKKKMPT